MLGAPVRSAYANVDSMVVEDVEIGPRRILVYSFPDDVREKIRSLGCSDRLILGVAEVESAGYVPDTATGKLQRIGLLVFSWRGLQQSVTVMPSLRPKN
jgi:hypothetical protein